MPKDRVPLQGKAFELLLAWLDSDPDRAALQYVRLHERLTKKFESGGCDQPEALADETFNRVAGQLFNGKEIHTPAAYLYGVAVYVMKEHCWRGPRQEDIDEDLSEKMALSDQRDEAEKLESERQLACLDECLDKLPPESRILALEYYAEDKTRKIDTRDRMAQRLGIASGVLRNRIFKLRNTLRGCVAECLARYPGGMRRERTR